MRNNLTCTVKSPGDFALHAYQEACFKKDGDAVYMCSAVCGCLLIQAFSQELRLGVSSEVILSKQDGVKHFSMRCNSTLGGLL